MSTAVSVRMPDELVRDLDSVFLPCWSVAPELNVLDRS
jgi:hypothetical protein